jgi:metallo-beta-lactamase class B
MIYSQTALLSRGSSVLLGRKLMRVVSSVILALAVAGSASAAQAPGTFAPGQTVSYEQRAELWGPGSMSVEPFKIVGNIYYVGAVNISAYIISTPEGLILIDTGTTLMQADLPRNIEKLGFKLTDVKVILTTHAHIDHIQGHAIMKRITGAWVVAMEGDAEAMRTGVDLSATAADGWEPIPIDRVIKDNETVTLGGQVMRAILTPGHTPGNTTWVTTVQDGGRQYNVIFGGMPTPIVGNIKYNTPAELVATSFRRLRELPAPDLMLGGHPEAQFRGKIDAMRAGQRPHPLMMAPGAWTTMLSTAESNYAQRVRDVGDEGVRPGRGPGS